VALNLWHQVLFDASDRDSVVLKAEGFVLVMNQCLPHPDREANLLPQRDSVMVAMF